MIPKLNKTEAVADYHAVDPQLTRLFYDSDSECAESVSNAGPPAPEPEWILKDASPEQRQEIEAELVFNTLWGDDPCALTPLQLAIQKVGKAARGEELAGRVADDLTKKIIAKIGRLICDENGDRLEKRRSTTPDIDAAEFLATFEDENSDAGRLVTKLIEQDDPDIHQFLRAITLNNNTNGAHAMVPKLLAKS